MIKDRGIIYLALAQLFVWAGLYYIFPALLIRWEQSLGWSKTDLTAAITLAIFLSALASPVAGRLIDLGKGPLVMAGSTILGGLCLLCLPIVTTLWQFYLIWGGIGIMLAGCLYEPCFALITRARGEKAKRGIIVVTLIAGFAGSISFPAAHSLSETYGWQTAAHVFALFTIFLGAPLMWKGARMVEQSGEQNREAQVGKLPLHNAFLSNPVFWLLAIGFALGAVLHGVTLHHLLPILQDRDIHPDVAVIAASFIGPMQVAGRLAMMAVEKHVSNHDIAMSCFVVMVVSILLLFAATSTPALLVGFVILFGGGYGIVSIIRPVIARSILGEKSFGAKSGALALVYLFGVASAPYLGSLVWEIGGYDLVFPFLVLLGIVGLFLYIAAHKLSSGDSILN